MTKRKRQISSKRREAISQLSRNLATFWLTVVPIALFSNFGTEEGIIVPLVGTVVAGLIFALLSVFIHENKDEDKPKEDSCVKTKRDKK